MCLSFFSFGTPIIYFRLTPFFSACLLALRQTALTKYWSRQTLSLDWMKEGLTLNLATFSSLGEAVTRWRKDFPHWNTAKSSVFQKRHFAYKIRELTAKRNRTSTVFFERIFFAKIHAFCFRTRLAPVLTALKYMHPPPLSLSAFWLMPCAICT